MLCVVSLWSWSCLVVVVCLVWCVCVCSCVLRHGEKTWKKPVCGLKKTSLCVHSQRLRVCRHHRAHVLIDMCAWCRYTRGRFERTHGDVSNPHTEDRVSSSVLLTKICPRMVITWPQRGPPKKPMDLTHFQFENRSRATRCRFLQSFAVPDEAVQFQSCVTLRRVTWFGLSPPSSPSSTNMYMYSVCVCVCVCVCVRVRVRVCARVYVYDLPTMVFMSFCYISYI